MNDTHDKPEHLEEIRDIIFGPQKREFEKRIREIHDQIDGLRNQIAQLVQDLNVSLLKELQSVAGSLEEKLRRTEEKGTSMRDELLHHAQQMETRFTAALHQAIQTSAERVSALDIQMKHLGESFNRALQQHDERREASVAQLLDRIRHEREDVAKLLDGIRLAAEEQAEIFARHLKQHEERMTTDRAEMMKYLEQAEARFDRSVQGAIQTAAEKIGAMDVKLNSTHKALVADISSLRAEVMADLEKRTAALTEGKVSRDAMAETLIELAKRIKGEEKLKLISQTKTTNA